MVEHHGAGDERWLGAYRIADLQLALDATAIREAVQGKELVAIPTTCPWVVGALPIRGRVVPIVDLRRVGDLQVIAQAEGLGAPATGVSDGAQCEPPSAPDCVVVVTHGGRTIGLRADRVLGFFAPACSTPCTGPERGALRGFVTDPNGAVFTEIDVPRLIAQVDVAVGWEDEPSDGVERSLAATDFRTNLIVLAGGEAFALPTEPIDSIEHVQALSPAPYAIAPCRGALEVRGARIPALDLVSFLGSPRDGDTTPSAAVVLRVRRGRIALLVDSVIDLGRISASSLQELAATAWGRGVVTGTLSGRELPAAWFGERSRALERILQLDAEKLQGALSETALMELEPTALLGHRSRTGEDRASASRMLSVLRFHAGVPLTTLLSEVVEVLPLDGEASRSNGKFVVSRGRSLPLITLEEVLGQEVDAGERHALVVDSDSGRYAVSVGRLEGIEVGLPEEQLPPGCVRNPRLSALCGGGGISLPGAHGRQVVLRIDLAKVVQGAAA